MFSHVLPSAPVTLLDLLKARMYLHRLNSVRDKLEPLLSSAVLNVELPDSEFEGFVRFARNVAREISITEGVCDALADIALLEFAGLADPRRSSESAILTRVDLDGNFIGDPLRGGL